MVCFLGKKIKRPLCKVCFLGKKIKKFETDSKGILFSQNTTFYEQKLINLVQMCRKRKKIENHCIERMEEDSFENYYLSREYQKCLSIGQRNGENNINNAWQHVIFIYIYKYKTGRPTLIVFSNSQIYS